MRTMKKALALLLTTVMLLSALPLGIFAAENGTSSVASTSAEGSNEQYYYKYTFDDLANVTNQKLALTSLGNTSFNSNPMGLDNDSSAKVLADIVADPNDSTNKFLRLDFARFESNPGSGSYFSIRPSLYDPATGIDHFLTGSTSVSFKFRWIGTDETCDSSSITFFRIRRKQGNTNLLSGKVDSNGDFVLSALTPSVSSGKYSVQSTAVYTFKKNSKDFSNIEIKYHSAFASYSLYIDGTPIVEEAYIGTDFRSSSYVTTEYDNDYMATSRKPVNGANLKVYEKSFEIFRVDNTTKKHAFVCDIDDFIIKEDAAAEGRPYYYTNSFDAYYTSTAALKQYNGFTNKITNYDPFPAFRIQGTASNLVHVYDETTKNGYLDFGSKTRLDLLDVAQIIQDGSWTVSFDIQASNSSTSLQTVIGMYDFINSPQVLFLDKDGYLYVSASKVKLTGAKIPAYGSDEWANVKLSVFYTNENEGTYYDFVSNSGDNAKLNRCYAVYVNDVLIGLYSDDARGEANSNTLITNATYTKTTISAEPTADQLSGYVLKENTGVRKTWEDANGNLYQVKYTANSDGTYTFSKGVKVTVTAGKSGDTLSFFRQDNTTNNAKVDNIKVYAGIGNPNLAGGKSDTTGVIGEVEFAKLNIHEKAAAMGNCITENGGAHGIFKTSRFTADSAVVATETVDGNTVDYVKINSDSNNSVYAEMSADYSGGKIFAGEITLRNVADATADFFLLRLRRQTETDTEAAFLDILKYNKDKGCVVFNVNGTTAYLCDTAGNPITLTGNKWTTLRAVIDETGETPLVTFYVNGKIACYTTNSNFVPLKAAELTGIISASITRRVNAIDQRVRFFETNKTSAKFDILSAKVEYATAPEGVGDWADSAAVDFSKITDLSELGEQFLISDGCYLEDGALVIPAGETFGWVDYNGVFANFRATNALDPVCQYRVNCGFNVEAKIKTAPTSGQSALMSMTSADIKNQIFVFMSKGKLYMSGGTSGYTINDLNSSKFSEISATYVLDDNNKTVFADGKMLGIVAWSGNPPDLSAGKEKVAFMFAENSIISEVYIHADQARTLALNSGNIFEIDPNAFLPSNSEKYPGMGIWELRDTYNKTATRVTNDGDFNYYRFNFVASADEITTENPGKLLTGQTFTDVVVTDYLEDKTTVFEYDLRFTRHEQATGANSATLIRIRRTEDGSTDAANVSENLLTLKDDGRLIIYNDYYLCDELGNDIVIPDGEWVNIAVIYDATAGRISYVINGNIYYYHKIGKEVIGLANNIQHTNYRMYRMDAADTKIRILDVNKGFYGKLDIADFKIYNTDATANAGYVGAQRDNKNNNIRLVAGTDMLYYDNVGFEVEAFDANGNSIANVTKSYKTKLVYSSIKETVNGASTIVYPENYGYRYFYTATINGIPQDKAVRLNVTPFTEVNGVRYNASSVTLDIDFTTPNMASWTLGTDSVEVKPAGTNTSADANFSTTEIVTYTRTGALNLNGLDAKFAFAADLNGGIVSVNLTNAKGEVSENSVFDVYVDGVLTREGVTLDFGHHTLVLAENLVGEHEFMIVKRSGGDFVCINNMSVCGTLLTPPELATENALYVEVLAPESGKDYGNVHVYVRTSDPSEKYYIRYHFNYVKVAPADYTYFTGKGSTNYNSDLYRIVEAHLVEKNSDGTFTNLFNVLQSGEISLAITERHLFTVEELAAAGKTDNNGNAYTEATNISATDFVGGLHGDENMEFVEFYIDGKPLDVARAGNYSDVTHFEFCQDSIINRCNEENEQVMLHGQKILLDTNGLRLNQHIEFLAGDFYPSADNTYLQMCTLFRVNTSLATTAEKADPANYVCADVALLDANGNVLATEDLRKDIYSYDPSLGTKNVWFGSDTKLSNRYIEYYGNNNGLYGKAGFVIPDASVKSDSARLAVRRGQGDNKWYASFDTYNGEAAYLGEIWNVNDYYFFDYNTTNIK